MTALAQTDPVPIALAHLRAQPGTMGLLGWDATRVRGDNVPPYPRIRLLPGTANDRALSWLIVPAVQVEAIGDLDGNPGPVALRVLLYTALADLATLPDQEYGPGETVVTAVASAAGGSWLPLPGGQPRWVATLAVYVHPPST